MTGLTLQWRSFLWERWTAQEATKHELQVPGGSACTAEEAALHLQHGPQRFYLLRLELLLVSGRTYTYVYFPSFLVSFLSLIISHSLNEETFS